MAVPGHRCLAVAARGKANPNCGWASTELAQRENPAGNTVPSTERRGSESQKCWRVWLRWRGQYPGWCDPRWLRTTPVVVFLWKVKHQQEGCSFWMLMGDLKLLVSCVKVKLWSIVVKRPRGKKILLNLMDKCFLEFIFWFNDNSIILRPCIIVSKVKSRFCIWYETVQCCSLTCCSFTIFIISRSVIATRQMTPCSSHILVK